MEKRRTQSENQIFPKEKQKTLQCFLFQNGDSRTQKSSPRKISEKSGKVKFHTKERLSVPSSTILFMEGNIVRQLDSRFFILLTS